jgi:parallel beta-helix repeat protein
MTWINIVRRTTLGVLIGGISCMNGLATGQDFTMIDYPGATGTYAYGINNGGDTVGDYVVAGVYHGFLLSGGKFTSIDYPGAKATHGYGINAQGDVVGFYADTGGHNHGYLLSKGKFTSLDYPGGDTWGQGINSAGDVVAMIQVPGKPMQGAILKGGEWTANDSFLDLPSATMNCYLGINDAGVIVGHWGTRAGGSHGVVWNKGTKTELDYGGGGNTYAYGINLAGDVAGYYYDASQSPHGYLRKNGRFTQIDYPGSPHTMAYAINDSGQVAGHFQDTKKVYHGFVAQVTPAGAAPPVITVDDDGLDCPGALHTIQEAVAQAQGGSTILVCPGTYRGTVNIIGQEKSGLSLIAVGRADQVVLQGDYTQRDGFHLENVSSVLIRGFTVRDFGNLATTATVWGAGNQIYLQNAHYNTIEQNRTINGDMVGIMVMDSGNNLVQNNFAWVNNASLSNCGIHVQGAKSANNLFQTNIAFGNNMAGIMLSGAGPGNRVADNITISNGRNGITNTGTDGTWIEGNRVSYNGGPWGTTPYAASFKGAGFGINIGTSTGVTVFDNRGRNNTEADINWDGAGTVKFDSNACDKSTAAGACAK